MAWIFIEGLDRTGKTTVCELYKKQGYEVVHFSAPSKKYSEAGYAGNSYVDDIMELYLELDNKDVVFDRSSYGELVWPKVYRRKAQLDLEDLSALRELERQNKATYILMHDPDMASHWKRCVANKEPMDRDQFKLAHTLFTTELEKFAFKPQTLEDYKIHFLLDPEAKKQTEEALTPPPTSDQEKTATSGPAIETKNDSIKVNGKSPEQARLEKANAINDVLSKKIVKGRGKTYDDIESSIRTFLNTELGKILGQPSNENLNAQEVEVLKAMVKRMLEKADTGLAFNKEKSNGKRI